MATKSSSTSLDALVINKVASSAVFTDMVNSGQVNENELYFVEGDVDLTYTLSQSGRTVTLTGSDGSTSSVTIPSTAAAQGSITTTTTWSGSGPYTQTVTVSGVTTTSASKVDI